MVPINSVAQSVGGRRAHAEKTRNVATGSIARSVPTLMTDDLAPDVPDRTEVFPNLWIGGKDAELGFDGEVIDLRINAPEKSGTLHLPVFREEEGGWVPNPVLAREAVEAISNALDRGEKVLVRCMSGVERSPAIAALYLVQKRGLTPTDAYARIRAARPQVVEEFDLQSLSYEERTRR
jgi:hypothetical protein